MNADIVIRNATVIPIDENRPRADGFVVNDDQFAEVVDGDSLTD